MHARNHGQPTAGSKRDPGWLQESEHAVFLRAFQIYGPGADFLAPKGVTLRLDLGDHQHQA